MTNLPGKLKFMVSVTADSLFWSLIDSLLTNLAKNLNAKTQSKLKETGVNDRSGSLRLFFFFASFALDVLLAPAAPA